jgi:hypothetical protein
LIGDTNSLDPQLQDEEIDFYLLQYNNGLTYQDQLSAAMDAVISLISKVSALTREEETGDIRVQLFSRVEQLEILLKRLDALAKTRQPISIFCGGISLDQMQTTKQNTDRNPNRVSQGIHNNPESPFIEAGTPGVVKQYGA